MNYKKALEEYMENDSNIKYYKKALKEYMKNYSTPKELADKYDLDLDKFRDMIERELKMEKINDEALELIKLLPKETQDLILENMPPEVINDVFESDESYMKFKENLTNEYNKRNNFLIKK